MKKSARLFCLLALTLAASAAASGQSLSRSWYNGSIVLDADEHGALANFIKFLHALMIPQMPSAIKKACP